MRIVPFNQEEKNDAIRKHRPERQIMNTHSPTVLILGARGRFGAAAVKAFAAAGWQVRAQSRRASASPEKGVTVITADAMDAAALSRAAQGADVIVNALNPLYTEWEELASDLADHALQAARSSGALLMMPGNVYNYGRQLPALLKSDTAELGDHAKARIRIEIEQHLRDAAVTDGVRSLVVRAGDFFGGEGRGSWFDLVIAKSLRRGKLVYPGTPDLEHAWAYLPDLAETFVQLAEQRTRFTGAHRVHFAGHTFSGNQLHTEVEAIVGRPLKQPGLPWGLLRIAALFSPMMSATMEMRYLWQRPHALDDSSLRFFLPVVPHTPLPMALVTALSGLGVLSAVTSVKSAVSLSGPAVPPVLVRPVSASGAWLPSRGVAG